MSDRFYKSDFFYGTMGTKDTDYFQIMDDDIEKIKRLKSHRSNASGYYDVMLQWRLEDNMDVVSDKNELSRLYAAMQFISMSAIIKEEFIKSYSAKKPLDKYHIILLRELYLEFDSSPQDISITMGFKRPFGNSLVLGDVRDAINRIHTMNQIQLESEDYSLEEKVLLEFVDFLEEFFKGGFELKFSCFKYNRRDFGQKYDYNSLRNRWSYLECQPHHYLTEWSFDQSEIRNQKIEKILN